jgi:hypothetical protein
VGDSLHAELGAHDVADIDQSNQDGQQQWSCYRQLKRRLSSNVPTHGRNISRYAIARAPRGRL